MRNYAAPFFYLNEDKHHVSIDIVGASGVTEDAQNLYKFATRKMTP